MANAVPANAQMTSIRLRFPARAGHPADNSGILSPYRQKPNIAPFCLPWISCDLPGVILNFATAYLRMMAANPVVAKEGGMKDYEEG